MPFLLDGSRVLARIRSAALKPALAVLAVVLTLSLPEVALRLIGFQYESGVAFEIPDAAEQWVAYQPHPELLFTFDPTHPKVNRYGFPDREVSLPKPDETFRILFLGDSCTQQGFPDQVARRLSIDAGEEGASFDAVTLAVAGYSSYQGRVLAREFAPLMEGDLAVVYFGWNDHWLANGAPPDSQRIAVQTELGPLQRFIRLLSERSRFFQLLLQLRVSLAKWGDPDSSSLRVPIGEYRANLQAIHDRLADLGMPVVFVTAPTSHYYFGAPAELVRDRFAADTESVPRLHRSYNQVVREVAKEEGALLLDLERDLGKLPPRKLQRVFSEDGIHFSDAGLRQVSRRIARFLREQQLLGEAGGRPQDGG